MTKRRIRAGDHNGHTGCPIRQVAKRVGRGSLMFVGMPSRSPAGHHAIQIAIQTCKHALTAFYELSESIELFFWRILIPVQTLSKLPRTMNGQRTDRHLKQRQGCLQHKSKLDNLSKNVKPNRQTRQHQQNKCNHKG